MPGGNATIHNTIIATNTASAFAQGNDVYGTLQSTSAHNLIGINTGLTGITNGTNGNLIGTQATPLDPKLGIMRNNGGATMTHALLPGSPAFDAGNNLLAVDAQGSPLTTDQRGYARVYGTSVDIGAFEGNQPFIGLFIDSDNSGRFDTPDRSPEETALKNDPNHYGKIIRPNWGDINGNGILDVWDGYNYGSQLNMGAGCSEKFVPIVIEISGNIDLASATFQFDFWSGSPLITSGSPALPPSASTNGNIRIWTKDGNLPRSGNDIKLYGNLITDGTIYTAQHLGFTDSGGNLLTTEITLYVEGHSIGSNVITVGMDYVVNGQTVHVEDAVKYTVMEFALTPYTPETKNIAPMQIPETKWKENGVGIRRNGDYDEGKASPDWTYGTASAKEDDLIRLDIDITPRPDVEYRLKAVSDTPDVRLWDSKLKGGYPLATYAGAGALINSSMTVYAEYISEGDIQETFILSAISTTTGQTIISEEIVFRPFNSITSELLQNVKM